MSKIKFIAKQFVVSLILLFSVLSMVSATDSNAESYYSISAQELKERIENLPSQVELRYTSEVHSIINEYIKDYRKSSEVLLGRSSQFFPIYESEFKKAGIPFELKYLSVVESSLRPTVVSKVGAVGLWQFMRGTGQEYGLTINSTVDERRDPMRSTQAAVSYLKDLYLRFGDWSLALAAYNCGPGGVMKAQKRSNAASDEVFWDIKPYLPRETRRYVPKFVAISYVMNYFQYHGLEPLVETMEEPLATVRVYDYTTFSQLSKLTGLDKSTIWRLNPAFLKGYVPKSSKGYLVTLPETKMYEYLSITDNWDDLEYRPSTPANEMHEIYLYGSMKRRVMSMEVMDLLPQTMDLTLHQLDIPMELPEAPEEPVQNDDVVLGTSSSRYKMLKLSAQQSLMDIVDLHDMTLEELIEINDIDINNPPAPGSLIMVRVAE